MRRVIAFPLGIALVLAGCSLQRPPPAASTAAPHSMLGTPYQAGGIWRYPHEQFDGTETGLATVATRLSGHTANGEIADATAMAAAHPTLQLPSVVQVTNLDTGLQVLVRVNDRGPVDPGRVIALTPRALQLLGAPRAAVVRVRVQVMEGETRRLAAADPASQTTALVLAAAPEGDVKQESLAPPPGAAQAAKVRAARPVARPAAANIVAPSPVPLRLPETVTRVPPRPGSLYVEAGAFGNLEYATLMRTRLAALGAEVLTLYDAPSERAYRVRIGPLPGVAAADATLARVIRAGVTDARIIAP